MSHGERHIFSCALTVLFCLTGFLGLRAETHTSALTVANDHLNNRDWNRAEAVLLRAFWMDPTAEKSIETAKQLARLCVIRHQGPQAMEWLETALNHPEITQADYQLIEHMVQALQRIYLTGYEYQPERQFRIEGADFESPRHLVSAESGNLIVVDRYRLIQLSAFSSLLYRVLPPTAPLPDRTRSLKQMNNNPVIITETGYWHNHRLFSFQSPVELSRIVDAVYTTDNRWFVMDRRNTNMFVFDQNGRFLEKFSITSPSGDEKLLAHPLGGVWAFLLSSRLITTIASPMNIVIPFRGPGYSLTDPVDFATDWFGHLYVLNRNRSVTVFSPAGVWLKTIQLDPRGDILRNPSAMTVSSNGSIFVADRKRHDVFCFR